jgi:putative ABC transport system permease protein
VKLVLSLANGRSSVNIMLVSVTERTREIGLRKALGATPREFFVQLVFETTIITVAAGGLGAGIIYFLHSIREVSARAEFLMPRITFPPGLALLSFVVLVSTGILAGLVPALRAARLDPAVALREE